MSRSAPAPRAIARPAISRALGYGALAAAGGALWTLLEYALGWHTTRADVGRWTGFVGLVFPIVAIVLALRAARRDAGGSLPFRRGLAVAATVSVVLGALGAAFFYAYHAWLDPASGNGAGGGSAAAHALSAGAAALAVGLVVGAVAAVAMRATSAVPAVPRAPTASGARVAR